MNNKLPWDLIVLKLRHESFSTEEEVRYSEWIESDEKNKELYIQLEVVWNKIQQKVEDYEPDLDYYWKELSARIETTPVEMRGSWFSRVSKRMSISRLARVSVAASVLLVLAVGATYLYVSRSGLTQQFIAYSTLNSRSHFFLPDSTEVWMNNNSELKYTYNKKSDQREVSLTGEAYFKVRRDIYRSFLVKSKEVTVKVHGTQFNVNSYSYSDSVFVSLYEGSVSMNTTSGDVRLKPGEEGAFSASGKTLTVRPGDLELSKVWTSDVLYFDKKNLREVCLYLSKWYGYTFDIDDDISDNQSYTFTFRGEPLADVITIIADINSYSFDIYEDKKVVRIRK